MNDRSPSTHAVLDSASFTPVSLDSPPRGRALLVELYDAAVAGAAPGPLTSTALQEFDVQRGQRIWVYAFGKAAHAMAAATVATLQKGLHTIVAGVVVAPDAQPSPFATISALVGDHPIPGRQSFAAAHRIGELASGMRSDDVALVLISGGATSLIGAPLRGMSEADLVQLYRLLLGSGLDIREMNAVRKRFTRWGGGRLAVALAPARTHAFIISDVEGDDPADIASGPCTPDSYAARDVIMLLQRTGLYSRIAAPMRDYLTGVVRGLTPETPRRTHPAFAHVATRVIGSNRLSTHAAAAHARALGLPVVDNGSVLDGDAARCGASLATSLLERARDGWRGCVIWGGETTVQLESRSTPAHGVASAGVAPETPRGGRCQELALAAARVLADGGEAARHVTLLAAGTDGRDGPTDAAGAFADATVWDAIRASGRSPELSLARHDSYAVLDAVGALHRRGHTGTNVRDVVIAVLE
ncbi:MAG: glycerate kinase [Gemmatimonadaceae bacterium]